MLSINATQQDSPARSFIDILDSLADGPRGSTLATRSPTADGYVDLTYRQLRDAVDAIAKRLRAQLAHIAQMTVGYVSNSHLDYTLNLLALLRLRVTPVLLSPRNTAQAQAQLLQASRSCALLFDADHREAAAAYGALVPELLLVPIVPLDQVADDAAGSLLSLGEDTRERVVVMMHSSGTTGFPKLIKMTNRYFLTMASRHRLNPNNHLFSTSFLAVSPLFHLFGLMNFVWIFSSGGTTVFPSGNSPAALLRDVDHSKVSFVCLLPYQIKQLAEYCHVDPRGWATLARCNGLHFGGAPLPEELSRICHQHGTTLFNSYGTTETGYLAGGISSPENITCRRLTLARDLRYSLVNHDGATAQLLIHPDEACLANDLCRDGRGYVLGDRIRLLRHEEPIQFEVLGRVDDTLVHPSGEKTYPVPMENALLVSPLIHRCVILNQDNIQNCLLVQLNVHEFLRRPPLDALQSVYGLAEEVNANAPAYSRIDHRLIYILPLVTDKELPATIKGNVARSKAALAFREEMALLYRQFSEIPEPSSAPRDSAGDSAGDPTRVREEILACFESATGKKLDPERDFFDQGLDSLSAVKLKNQLAALYPTARITANTLYANNTASLLAQAISLPARPTSLASLQNEVDGLIAAHTHFQSLPSPPEEAARPSKQNVLVTGANGSLGGFLINVLLQQPWVDRVYALARAPSPKEAAVRIHAGFESRRIHLSDEQRARLQCLSTGLETVADSIHVVYHAAWRMDFLRGVTQFSDCIQATVDLLRICATSPTRPSFHFVSSIGAALPVLEGSPIPEVELSTHLVREGLCTGYNLSKLVSETICMKWARHFGFPLHIHRVGQVAGDTEKGVWNTQEHIPLLIKASQVMGMLPKAFTPFVSWIPVDVAARAMVELNTSVPETTPVVHHIANPNLTSWQSVLDLLHAAGLDFQHVAPQHFVDALRTTPRFQDPAINPLASLTQFWETLLAATESEHLLDTALTQRRSAILQQCPAMDAELVAKYIRHWTETGFLAPEAIVCSK